MRRLIHLLLGFALAVGMCAPTAAFGASGGGIVAFPTLASVQNVGASAPSYPDIFVVSYTSTGGGANFHWTAPCPAVANGVAQIAITGVTSGCYVQAIPVSASLFASARSGPVTSTTTLTVGDSIVQCDSTAGNVRIIAPPSLGSVTLIKKVRIEKVSAANLCSISADGVTDIAYIVNANDNGGAGYLDVEM
ncbi:MAG: hypothetical protein KGL35_15990, partial [Bradyrhizobium sp.]|nr:hypothetical protein [Bradyrhizobium sp.]